MQKIITGKCQSNKSHAEKLAQGLKYPTKNIKLQDYT